VQKKEMKNMVKAERRAEATWEGNLARGHGSVRVGSGAVPELPVTWASRTERSDGKTSPEELIAAAHAACFSMALSHTLSSAGKTPERLTVNAVCTFEQTDAGFRIGSMTLDVRGKVPGLDAAGFDQAAQQAGQNCPVSQALHNNVQIRVNAQLEA
jgi:osmotically inducible protein OsmC